MEQKAIDNVIEQFFRCFTETGEQVTGLLDLFDANGQVLRFTNKEVNRYTISEFVDSRIEILKSDSYQSFKEYELELQTVIDGRHAVRLSHYEKVGKKDGSSFKFQGTKVFHLVKKQDECKILSISWMNKAPEKEIELRLVSENDAQLLYDLMTAKKWLNYIGDRGIKTLEDAKQYILDTMHPDLQLKGFVNHVVIDSETKEEVGTCSLHNREGVEGLDVGYAILEKYEGNGYATTSAKMMVELAFNTHRAEVVRAITRDSNVGSCRVLEKVGFKHEGYVQLPKGEEQLKLYILPKKDWK
ncbi:GNAT family N-acetyltransferase [Roseivirga seohaensis]|uniref:GNAT family N-acetyltransferase n=1 Tax=Roseivirga seohaensis TaxID=1914963 RepID=UPI003BAA3927